MTKKKTSMEKLETRNETVTDMSSALIASRWKWREIKNGVIDLSNLIDHKCGFCVIAQTKGERKCDHCPENVSVFCEKVQERTSEKLDKLEYEINVVLDFLKGLKYEEVKTDEH